ncbi:MAG: YraN family protein [Gemmatales bacterium]|nr:YraN family protein [Gemmatales bacterium]MDW7993177.1 YraN family protein [Gemmatales bacterium]
MSLDPRQPEQRRKFGQWAEQVAAEFLQRHGYRILFRNYQCRLGELDIVAREGNTVVFIEVRATSSGDAVRAALSLDQRKQARLWRLAQYFFQRHGLHHCAARFDAVVLTSTGDRPVAVPAAPNQVVIEPITGPEGQQGYILLYRNVYRHDL